MPDNYATFTIQDDDRPLNQVFFLEINDGLPPIVQSVFKDIWNLLFYIDPALLNATIKKIYSTSSEERSTLIAEQYAMVVKKLAKPNFPIFAQIFLTILRKYYLEPVNREDESFDVDRFRAMSAKLPLADSQQAKLLTLADFLYDVNNVLLNQWVNAIFEAKDSAVQNTLVNASYGFFVKFLASQFPAPLTILSRDALHNLVAATIGVVAIHEVKDMEAGFMKTQQALQTSNENLKKCNDELKVHNEKLATCNEALEVRNKELEARIKELESKSLESPKLAPVTLETKKVVEIPQENLGVASSNPDLSLSRFAEVVQDVTTNLPPESPASHKRKNDESKEDSTSKEKKEDPKEERPLYKKSKLDLREKLTNTSKLTEKEKLTDTPPQKRKHFVATKTANGVIHPLNKKLLDSGALFSQKDSPKIMPPKKRGQDLSMAPQETTYSPRIPKGTKN